MRVRFVRSGGFAGMRLAHELDMDSLPPGESTKVQEYIDSADFFSLPEKIAPTGSGADQYTYLVTVEGKGALHTVQVSETAVPSGLRPLISYLMDRAKKR